MSDQEYRDIGVICIEIINPENFNAFGALKIDHAVEVIEETLDLKHHEIVAIRKFGINPRRIDIGIIGSSFQKQTVQESLGESVRISSGHTVSISLPNSVITDVYVKGAPIEWSEVRYSRIFGYYGDVKFVKFMNLKEEDTSLVNYANKENGIVKIRMKIKKEIPSSITIDNERIETYHRNQRRTCWNCGQGHFKRNCEVVDSSEFVNRFTLEEFPALKVASRVTQSAAMVETEAAESEATARVLEVAAARKVEAATAANVEATAAVKEVAAAVATVVASDSGNDENVEVVESSSKVGGIAKSDKTEDMAVDNGMVKEIKSSNSHLQQSFDDIISASGSSKEDKTNKVAASL